MSEAIQFKSKGKGRAHIECGRRSPQPAECLQAPATGQAEAIIIETIGRRYAIGRINRKIFIKDD
jgi:uncharacterized protein YfaQ (DUF2300 family)